MNRILSLVIAGTALMGAVAGFAADAPAKPELTPALRAQLASKLPGAKPENIRETPVPGLYEVAVDTSVGYISADGRYVISGDLFEIASRTNLTDARKADTRRKMLAGVKEDQMII